MRAILRPDTATTLDIALDGYEPVGPAWLATKIVMAVNGKVIQTEEYSDWKTEVELPAVAVRREDLDDGTALGQEIVARRRWQEACGRARRDVRRAASAHRPCARPSQLPAVLQRPERLARRHVDHARRDELARLSTDRLGVPARRRRLLGADPDAGALAVRRRARRSMGPANDSRLDASAVGAAIARARRARAHARRSRSTWIIVLQIAQGVINAFDTPARQSFVVQMVDDPADLPNAIALNSTMVNASRIIGPSIGGLIIAAVGEGWCFLIDAISYIAVIASLLAMRVAATKPRAEGRRRCSTSCAPGSATSSGFPPVRTALILLAIVSAMGMPYTVLMPVIATNVFHGGAHTLGFLMTASGLGAVAGALYLASRPNVLGLGRVMVVVDARVRRGARRVRPRAIVLGRAAACCP